MPPTLRAKKAAAPARNVKLRAMTDCTATEVPRPTKKRVRDETIPAADGAESSAFRLCRCDIPRFDVVGCLLPASCPLTLSRDVTSTVVAPSDAASGSVEQAWSRCAETLHRSLCALEQQLDSRVRAPCAGGSSSGGGDVGAHPAPSAAASAGQQQGAGEWLSVLGTAYTQRDTHQAFSNGFPNGEALTGMFSKATLSLEMLLEDAGEAMAGVRGCTGASDLAPRVLAPLFRQCKEWVLEAVNRKIDLLRTGFGVGVRQLADLSDDRKPGCAASFECLEGAPCPSSSSSSSASSLHVSPFSGRVAKVFWLSTQQRQLLAAAEGVTDAQVDADVLGAEQCRTVMALHEQLKDEASRDEVAYGSREQQITFRVLARLLMKFLVICELSDPPCLLAPAPGCRVKYSEKQHREIISGPRTHGGRIADGDDVEVLFPGITFVAPSAGTSATATAVRALVQRLPRTGSGSTGAK